MITQVFTKHFKGHDFTVQLGGKTIITGPNGAGKSAVIQALQLALEGQVTGAVHKTNQAIMEAFASGSPMYVEARASNKGTVYDLGRQFTRDAKGSVTQGLLVDRRKVDQRVFIGAAGSAGSPTVIAVDEFLALSSKAMIAHLAKNFGGDQLDGLGEKVERVKAKLLKRQNDLRENELFISRTAKSVSDLNLPPESAAQVTDELERTTQKLKAAEAELSAAKEEVEAARRKAEKAAAPPTKSLAAELARASAGASMPKHEGSTGEKPPGPVRSPEALAAEECLRKRAQGQGTPINGNPADSIRKIIEAIVKVGCPGCSAGGAINVAKMELRRWEVRQ